MQRFLPLTALSLGLALGTAHASEGSPAPVAASPTTAPALSAPGTHASNYQVHEKFRSRTRAAPQRKITPPKVCNVDASDKKGDERAASLSACLKS